ncbi:MAG: ABC transporter permease [Bacteroidetes bacterium]|nr:ABC transporter permease [Bacteroidota bacterium]
MLKNYLLATVRSLQKHFYYSAVNVSGIGLGLATCVLLFLWIQHELSFDQFHENADRIYRGSLEYSFGGQTAKTSVSPTALLPVLKKNFTEVETGVRIYNMSSTNPFIIKTGDNIFQEKKFYFADSTFFDVFSFPLLRGNSAKALTEPHSILLTQAMAKKYFDTEDVIGKLLTVNSTEYKITGLLQDPPSNSMIQLDFVASFSSLGASKEQIWWSANYQTFFLLNKNTDVNLFGKKVNALVKKELATELSNPGDYVVYNFTPLTNIYLRSDVDEPEIVGNIQYVYIFSAIAILVLAIACINYINLATAKAVDRAREVGVRKVAGAQRGQLFIQFITESMVITLLGFGVAFILSSIGLSFFNSLTGKNFILNDIFNPEFLMYCGLIWLVISFLSGIYPALAIASYKPVSVLKGNFKNSGNGMWLRQSLVVIQFSVSIMLMIGTAVILNQLDYIQNKKLGYDKENVIVLPLDSKTRQVYDQLKTEFIRSGKVVSVARATEPPTKINGGYTIKSEGSSSRGIIVTAMAIDQDFIPTVNMKIMEGRNFTEADFKKQDTDSVMSLLVNQAALKAIGLTPTEAIGRIMEFQGSKAVIAGVVEDFHFSSLHEKISPLVLFTLQPGADWQARNAFVKLSPGNINESLDQLKAICSSLLTHRPFEYEFLDQQYQKMYSKEQRMGKVTTVFSALAIAIACLGLLGLVAFAATQKTKEIGIRKVLGASSVSVVALITRSYLKPIVVALAIGIPSAYFIMNEWWLQSFAYHSSVSWIALLVAPLICIGIAMITASLQALRAALADPVRTLRSE